jgi:hypothetical protein
MPRRHQYTKRASEGMANHPNASDVNICPCTEPCERRGGFIQLFGLEEPKLHAIAAINSFGHERARHLVAV